MNRIAVALAVFAVLAVAAPAGADAAGRPPGAVKLGTADLKGSGGVVCGRIAGTFVPGTRLSKGYFISHARQAENLARKAHKARGKKRRSMRFQAKRFTARAKSQAAACAAVRPDASPGAPTPSPNQQPSAPARAPGAGTGPAPTGGSPVAATPRPLRFALKGAVGIALRSSRARVAARQATDGSNVQAVGPNREVKDAVTSGSARVSRLLIAPNDKVYVLFSDRVNLDDTSQATSTGCLLAEIDPENGVPVCVDNTLVSVRWEGTINAPIQFDATGAIHYTGYTTDNKSVLRRSIGGTTTDLLSDQATLGDFLVLPNGSVVITGSTPATQTSWVRRINPQGGLSTVAPTNATFLRLFPDGNVYFGLWGPNDFGIKRFLTASNTVDARYWLSGNTNGVERDAYFKAEPFCDEPGETEEHSAMCGSYGTWVKSMHRTMDGKVFGLASAGTTQLVQYYPEVRFPTTLVKNPTRAVSIVNNLILAGTDADGAHVLTLLDSSSGTETTLVGADQETEIFHVNFAAGNRVLFDGLRFADNKYVLGQVDLETGQVTMSPAGATRWADFQTFG